MTGTLKEKLLGGHRESRLILNLAGSLTFPVVPSNLRSLVEPPPLKNGYNAQLSRAAFHKMIRVPATIQRGDEGTLPAEIHVVRHAWTESYPTRYVLP